MLHIFQKKWKVKINNQVKPNSLWWEPIIDLERTIAFILNFFLKVEPIIPSKGRLIILKVFVSTGGTDSLSCRNLL